LKWQPTLTDTPDNVLPLSALDSRTLAAKGPEKAGDRLILQSRKPFHLTVFLKWLYAVQGDVLCGAMVILAGRKHGSRGIIPARE